MSNFIHSLLFLAGWLVALDSAEAMWGNTAGWFVWGCGMVAYVFLLQMQEDKK